MPNSALGLARANPIALVTIVPVIAITPSGGGAHRLGGCRSVFCSCMDPAGLEQIASELCQLLQEQIELVTHRKFNDLTEEELAAYQKRKARILALRSQLAKFAKPN